MEVVEAEVTAKLGREKGQPRQTNGQAREIDWRCGNCGCTDANYFIRDGPARRELQTGWGIIQNLQVPMLECQHCKHDMFCNYAILEKYKRFWMDLSQDAFWSSGCGQSLRDICDRWSAIVGHPVGLRTVNERINQLELLVQQWGRCGSLPPSPASSCTMELHLLVADFSISLLGLAASPPPLDKDTISNLVLRPQSE